MRSFFLGAFAAAAIASPAAAADQVDRGPGVPDPIAERAEGRRLVAERRWPEAAAVFRRLVDRDPDRGSDWYFLGLSLARTDCTAARPALDRALALGATGSAGGLRQARVEAAGCAAAAGEDDAAFAHLEMAQGRLGFSGFAALESDARFASLLRDPRWAALSGKADARDRVAGWRSDLAWFAELIARRHRDPFHTVSEGAWRAEAKRLDTDIPRLTDLEVIGRFMRLAAMIGDGHTSVYPPFEGPRAFRLLPIWPYRLGEDWYVVGAAPDHADLVGGRIVGIGGRPTAEVMAELSTLLAHDNDSSLRWISAVALQFAEVAQLAAGADSLAFDIETASGDRRAVALPAAPIDRNPLTPWAPAGWPTMGPDQAPLWLSRADEPWWFADIDTPRAVFVQVNQVREPDPGALSAFAARVGERLRADPEKVLILDLRHNNGGDGSLNWDLVREVVRCGCDRPGGVFVLTGRRTFSAAQNLASMLETHTSAIFVGEPTGSRPNFHGEDTEFTLPWSGLRGSISSAWFQGGQTSFDTRPWIAPDLPAPLTLAHLRTGRDPALEAIAAWLSTRPPTP